MPVAFRGGRTCPDVAKLLPLTENVMLIRGRIRHSLDIMQLGYNQSVRKSAGTHDEGGAVDLKQHLYADMLVLRECGWRAHLRSPAQGFDWHIHMWPNGCLHMSPELQWQDEEWERGNNGLVGRGPIVGPRNVPHWTVGVERCEKIMANFADEVAEKAARKVWGMDIVKAPPGPNQDSNPTWQAQSYMATMVAQNRAILDALAKLSADIKAKP